MLKNTIATVLSKAIAAPFFRRHAGLFLALFLVLFGIQPTFKNAIDTHYQLMIGILTSFRFYLVALGVWVLYSLKVALYLRGTVIRKNAFDFLYNLNALAPAARFGYLLQLCIRLMLPVIGYVICITGIAVWKHYFIAGLLVLTTAILLTLLLTFFFYRRLQLGKAAQEESPLFRIRLPGNLFSFYFASLFRMQFPALLLVKVISFSVIYAFTLTDPAVFEDRILWLLYLLTLTGHSILVYRGFHFLEKDMVFYRNLPLSRVAVFFPLLGVYLLLLLPEAWALRALITVYNNPGIYFSMAATGPAMLLLFHALLLTEDMKMEDFLKLLAGIGFLSLFCSFSAMYWLLPVLCFTGAAVIFCISFYGYEKNTAVEGLE